MPRPCLQRQKARPPRASFQQLRTRPSRLDDAFSILTWEHLFTCASWITELCIGSRFLQEKEKRLEIPSQTGTGRRGPSSGYACSSRAQRLAALPSAPCPPCVLCPRQVGTQPAWSAGLSLGKQAALRQCRKLCRTPRTTECCSVGCFVLSVCLRPSLTMRFRP